MRIAILLSSFFVVGIVCWFFMKHIFVPDHKDTVKETEMCLNAPAVTIKGVTLREYSKKRDYELVLTAQRSVCNHRLEAVDCSNVVCTILKNGIDVGMWQAEHSCIDRINKIITCHGPISGRFDQLTFQGNDLVYDFEHQSCVIKHGVMMEFLNSPAGDHSGD